MYFNLPIIIKYLPYASTIVFFSGTKYCTERKELKGKNLGKYCKIFRYFKNLHLNKTEYFPSGKDIAYSYSKQKKLFPPKEKDQPDQHRLVFLIP